MNNFIFKHISFSYDVKTIVNDFSFVFEEGRTYCMLGPSGSGKTTVLRLIAGLEVPQLGSLFLCDLMLSNDNGLVIPSHKRETGFVFQDLALWPHFNVYDNIAFGLKERKSINIDKEVKQILDLFGIADQADKFPHQLSGGQKQMVAISRALVLKPRILLLDEPMANIDLHVKEHILSHLYQLQKQEKFTMIYVTHDHRDAWLSEEIVIMNEGKIVESGSIEHVRSSTNVFVKSFIKV